MKTEFKMSKLVMLAIILWALFLISLVTFPGGNTLTVLIPIIAVAGSFVTIAAVVKLMLGAARPIPQRQEFSNNWLTKSLAVITPVLLIGGTYFAIRSLWVNVIVDPHTKFLYNGLANGLGFGAIAAISFLSAAQKNIYWLGRDKSLKLDEMQIQERRKIFEVSYKISAWLVLIAAWLLYVHISSLPAIIKDSTNISIIQSSLAWPFINLALTLFALPLVIASWPRKLIRN